VTRENKDAENDLAARFQNSLKKYRRNTRGHTRRALSVISLVLQLKFQVQQTHGRKAKDNLTSRIYDYTCVTLKLVKGDGTAASLVSGVNTGNLPPEFSLLTSP